jgi:hypothetical protein
MGGIGLPGALGYKVQNRVLHAEEMEISGGFPARRELARQSEDEMDPQSKVQRIHLPGEYLGIRSVAARPEHYRRYVYKANLDG